MKKRSILNTLGAAFIMASYAGLGVGAGYIIYEKDLGEEMLIDAIRDEQGIIASTLISLGADVNYKHGAPLARAFEEQNKELVQELRDHGAYNFPAHGEMLLRAVSAHDISAVAFLLDNGVEAGFRDELPVKIAVTEGNADILKLLIEHYFSHGQKISSIEFLIETADKNRDDDVRQLLEDYRDSKNVKLSLSDPSLSLAPR